MAYKEPTIPQKNTQTTVVSKFSGLDLSTQRFNVAYYRAIDLLNYYYKDGVIQKRQGIEELNRIEPYNYIPYTTGTNEYKTNGVNINGLWTFTGEDNKEHLIAHIGRLLFEIKDDFTFVALLPTNETNVFEGKVYHHAYEFLDYKSNAFVGSKRLYFLGGNKYMCLRFLDSGYLIHPVENHEDTYIPTTTISITYKNSVVSSRAGLDNVNLLTKWRKNELLSGTQKNDLSEVSTDNYEYILDAPIIPQDRKDMNDFLVILEERGTF